MNKRQWKKYKKKRGKSFIATGGLARLIMERIFPSPEVKIYADIIGGKYGNN